jgi:signal transduction histidine kinase
MTSSLSELASAWARWQAAVEPLLREAPSPAERAGRLADLLLEAAPGARLAACLAAGTGPPASRLAVRQAPGQDLPEGAGPLLGGLDGLGEQAAGVRPLPAAGPLSSLRLTAAAVGAPGHAGGFLVLGLPAEAAPEDAARADLLLAVCADALALRQRLEATERERAELAVSALLGQAFAGLAHDLNNLLNSMILQTSVVQMRVAEPLRGELTIVRQHGAQAAGLVRTLQHSARQRLVDAYPVDLNDVVREVLEEGPGGRVQADLAPELPSAPLRGTRADVKQLVRLVLGGALGRQPAALRLRTMSPEGGVRLRLETEEVGAEGGEAGPFDADAFWQELDDVGRAAGRWLVRHLNGVLSAERRPGGGIVLNLDWGPSAPGTPGPAVSSPSEGEES